MKEFEDRYVLIRTIITDEDYLTITEHISDPILAVRAAAAYMTDSACNAVTVYDRWHDFDFRSCLLRWQRD